MFSIANIFSDDATDEKKLYKLNVGINSKSIKVVVLVFAGLALVAGLLFVLRPKQKPNQGPTASKAEEKKTKEAWTEVGAAVAGKYADADIVFLGDGKYRMYYAAEPETPGFNGQVYSSISSDGVTWTKENGTRIASAIFPSVIKLPDGKYRMYFQDQSVIKSALSSDGLVWNRESGTRIDASNTAGLNLSSVLSPTVIRTQDAYLMVYVGEINQEYQGEKVPNKKMHLLLWATSEDGLSFEKKGIAVDSRNSQLKGWFEGPDLVDDGNTIKLFAWSYTGIYESRFTKNSFSQPQFVFLGPNVEPNAPFPANPPCDPTVVKIGKTWNMYYGYHTKGIYRAVMK